MEMDADITRAFDETRSTRLRAAARRNPPERSACLSRPRSNHSFDRPRWAVRLIALAIAYFVAAVFGSLPAGVGGNIVGIGLPAGLALSALLVFGAGLWPGIALGALLAALTLDMTFPGALLIAGGNTLGAVVPALVLNESKLGIEGLTLHLRGLGWFVLVGAAAGPALGITVASLGFALGLVPGVEMDTGIGVAAWMTQALGVIVFTPFLVSAARRPWVAPRHFPETLAWFGLLSLLALQVFANWPLTLDVPFGGGLLFPLLTLFSLRGDSRAVGIALISLVMCGWFCSRAGWGDFGDDMAATGLRHFWFFSTALVLTGLAVSVVSAERRRSEGELSRAVRIVESMQEGVMVTDREGRILSVNPAFSEITGYTPGEVIGRDCRLLDSVPDRGTEQPERREALAATGRWQGESWGRRRNGELYPLWQRIAAVVDRDGSALNYVAVFSDISAFKVSQEELEHLAHHDVLTGLPNRLLFRDRLDHAIQRAQRAGRKLAVLFLDLDRFKHVNDSLGHSAGDQLLREVALRLQSVVRRDDTLARLGGDEFTVLMEGLKEGRDAAVLAEKLLGTLREPFRVHQHELYVSTSIGISVFPQDALTTESLLRNADAAMYRAKDAGRNAYWYYSQEMTVAALDRVVLEAQLRQAIELGQLLLHFQPQVDLSARRLVGVEALVRWNHPTKGFIPPARFIPIAEESGLIIPLGDWVLQAACRQAKAWLDAGIEFGVMAVNVSAPQILRGTLRDSIENALEATGLPPSRLELEINESFVMEQPVSTKEQFLALRQLGVTLAIDDFGTAYSSLAYLKRLPVDKLKIDRSFILDLPHDSNDAGVARAVIALGHSLQFRVIAEGVETERQHDFLKSEGCDLGQGYLYSQALAAAAVEELLRHWPYRDEPDPPDLLI